MRYNDVETIAYHEAGHAIVLWHYWHQSERKAASPWSLIRLKGIAGLAYWDPSMICFEGATIPKVDNIGSRAEIAHHLGGYAGEFLRSSDELPGTGTGCQLVMERIFNDSDVLEQGDHFPLDVQNAVEQARDIAREESGVHYADAEIYSALPPNAISVLLEQGANEALAILWQNRMQFRMLVQRLLQSIQDSDSEDGRRVRKGALRWEQCRDIFHLDESKTIA